jgi:L-lactate dehydrogenase complex protein LldG
VNARTEVLTRIRQAIGESRDLPVARQYRRAGDHPPGAPDLVELFADRVRDYRAEVVGCDDNDAAIAAAISGVLAARHVSRLVVPPGVPEAWLPVGQRVVDGDPPLTHQQLDQAAGVLTGSTVAMAETGTIVLDGSALCGRRAITLVPDLHLVVVRGDDIVESVPEGLARLDPRRPLTFISGPSATSDIELERVEGVHGPRQLVAIVASPHAAYLPS